jgi:NADP-dependent 3-hydroxy acid dehydrogenase YdfG
MNQANFFFCFYKKKGLGLTISKYLLTTTPPNNVVILARSAEPLQALKTQYPDNVEYIAGNLSDHSLGEKAVALAQSRFGRLDGLVLNHGILGQVSTVANADVEQWKKGFEVNFFSLVSFVSFLLFAFLF